MKHHYPAIAFLVGGVGGFGGVRRVVGSGGKVALWSETHIDPP